MKRFIVIGLGNFGAAVAETLYGLGHEVVALDTDPDRVESVADAVAHFRARYDVIDVDGVRVLFGDGWGLIRASNTQPVLVLRFEARSEARLAEIRSEFETWRRARGVDPTPSAHG